MTRNLLIILLAVVVLTLNGCGKSDNNSPHAATFERIKKERILRVGYVIAPPWVIRDPSTRAMEGTFVNIIEEIARQMDVKVEFVEANLATFAAGLQSRQYDVSIAPTFVTVPRAMSVAFSVPLLAVGNSAIVRKGEIRFKTLTDIDRPDIVVAVTQGEQGHEYAKTNFKNANIKVFSGGDQNLTFSEVLTNRADIALGDAWFTAQFAASHPEAQDLFAHAPYNVTPVAWAVRYNDLDLLAFLNASLESLDSIGKLEEIDRAHGGAKWLRLRRVWR